jgi:hypothetical protein
MPTRPGCFRPSFLAPLWTDFLIGPDPPPGLTPGGGGEPPPWGGDRGAGAAEHESGPKPVKPGGVAGGSRLRPALI